MRAVIVQHVPFEGPGMIAPALTAAGAEPTVVRADLGQALPGAADVDVLVVMGGPMGAMDDADHPFLAGERALIRACVRRHVPVLGVCLGAQLLAATLGAQVRRGPEPEVGFGEVVLTDAGRDDPVLSAAGPILPVLHWHQDTFDLPPGARLLASSSNYLHQAFVIGRSYGLQFHVEMDQAVLDAVRPHLPPGVVLDPAGGRRVQEAGEAVLRRWAATALNR